jgi:hypothetical protein
MAVLGIVVMILGRHPRKNPPQPYWRLMIEAATARPFADLISTSLAVPLVCSSVLMTSSGVVRPAAKAPARPPSYTMRERIVCFRGIHDLRDRLVRGKLKSCKWHGHTERSRVRDVECGQASLR